MEMSFLQLSNFTIILVFLTAYNPFFKGDGLTLCQRIHQNPLGSSEQNIYVPQCNLDGSFEEVQCHGSSNECWCVDEQGSELNGTRRKGPLKCTGLGVFKFELCVILFILNFKWQQLQ